MAAALLAYPSFERSIKGLDPRQKAVIGLVLEALCVYLEHNSDLLEAQKHSPRFFFKKLRAPYYEAGVENQLRVVLEKHAGNFYAVLAGNHDQIKRFLSRI